MPFAGSSLKPRLAFAKRGFLMRVSFKIMRIYATPAGLLYASRFFSPFT